MGGPLLAGSMVIVRHSLRLPPGHLQRRNEAIMLDEEGCVEPEDQEPTTSEDSGATLLRGVFCKFVL